MKQITVDLYFNKPPCYSWSGKVSTKMEAKGMARQDAIAKGFKDEVKRIEVEVKS